MESEWTLKNIAKRILVYSILLIPMVAAWSAYTIGHILFPIIAAIIPIGYFILDWTIIIRKMKQNKNGIHD